MSRLSLVPLATALAACLVSCVAEDPGVREEHQPDGGAALGLEAPRLIGAVPVQTPLASVALRGKTSGSRIIVTGGPGGPVVKLPLPSGDFCVDVPLRAGESTTLSVLTLEGGLVSPPTEHVVAQDSAAPKPANPYCDPPACNGACPATEGACADGKDNDLDGWTDECDLDCSGCADDVFEPNSYPAAVPFLPLDETHDLKLCPCHDDWLAVYLKEGTKLAVNLRGDDPGFNINMKLYRAEDAEKGGYKSNTPLRDAGSGGSEEAISWEADKSGMYYIYVYSTDSKGSGGYKLTATVSKVTQ